MTSAGYVLSVQRWLVDIGLLHTVAQDHWTNEALNALKGAVYHSSAVDPNNLTVLLYAPAGYRFNDQGTLIKHEEIQLEATEPTLLLVPAERTIHDVYVIPDTHSHTVTSLVLSEQQVLEPEDRSDVQTTVAPVRTTSTELTLDVSADPETEDETEAAVRLSNGGQPQQQQSRQPYNGANYRQHKKKRN
jgi:hypothetical protein